MSTPRLIADLFSTLQPQTPYNASKAGMRIPNYLPRLLTIFDSRSPYGVESSCGMGQERRSSELIEVCLPPYLFDSC
jgi:hypothetical protein